MAPNPNLADTPPQDTPPKTVDELMLEDLGVVVAASEQEPNTPPAGVGDDEQVPDNLMRDDYLKRLNKLNAEKAQLAEEKLEFERAKAAGARQDPPPGDEDEQLPVMPNVGESTILARFGLQIDPSTLESPQEKAMYRALQILETVVERHMIATDAWVKKTSKELGKVDTVAKAHQGQAVTQAQKILGGATAQIKDKYGIDVDAKTLAASVKRYGAGLMESMKTGITPELVLRAWLVDNPGAQPKAKAPAGQPKGQPVRAKVPPIAASPTTPATPAGTPQGGPNEATGRRRDDELMLADLMSALQQ